MQLPSGFLVIHHVQDRSRRSPDEEVPKVVLDGVGGRFDGLVEQYLVNDEIRMSCDDRRATSSRVVAYVYSL
nr:hypothetical protein [Mycobacterium sp.]